MKRRSAEADPKAAAARREAVAPAPSDTAGHTALSQRKARPHTREDAEARYIAARDEWTKAMRAASSGRPADLASLALTQEAYEAAATERERWITGGAVAVPIEPEATRHDLETAVGQEMAWRRVMHHEKPQGFLGRLKRRITG